MDRRDFLKLAATGAVAAAVVPAQVAFASDTNRPSLFITVTGLTGYVTVSVTPLVDGQHTQSSFSLQYTAEQLTNLSADQINRQIVEDARTYATSQGAGTTGISFDHVPTVLFGGAVPV